MYSGSLLFEEHESLSESLDMNCGITCAGGPSLRGGRGMGAELSKFAHGTSARPSLPSHDAFHAKRYFSVRPKVHYYFECSAN